MGDDQGMREHSSGLPVADEVDPRVGAMSGSILATQFGECGSRCFLLVPPSRGNRNGNGTRR